MAEKDKSPLKLPILPIIGAVASIGSSIYGAVQAGKQQRAAEAKEKRQELKWIDLEMYMLI